MLDVFGLFGSIQGFGNILRSLELILPLCVWVAPNRPELP